jgi:hypothetical protein
VPDDDEIELSLHLHQTVVAFICQVQDCEEAQSGADQVLPFHETAVYLSEGNLVLVVTFNQRFDDIFCLSDGGILVALHHRPFAALHGRV